MRTKLAIWTLAAVLCGLGLAESAEAQLFRRIFRRRRRTTVQQPAPQQDLIVVQQRPQQRPQPERTTPVSADADEGDVTYRVAPQPPPAPIDPETQERLEAQLAERIANLVLKKLEAAAQGKQLPPTPEESDPAAPPAPEPEPEPKELTALELAQDLVSRRCTTCHRHDGSDAEGIALGDLSKLTPLQGLGILKKTYHGEMPKKGEPLTDSDFQHLLRWVVER